MPLHDVGGQIERGQRDAHLDSSLQFEELEMQIDRACQLRMALPDRVQLHRFA
jgi:hypothetical protein